jgi:hypothetical protein
VRSLAADHQQGLRLDEPELVDHGLGVDHVRGQRLIPGDTLLARSGIHAGKHCDPAVVFGLPLAVIVRPELIRLDTVKAGLELGLVGGGDGCVRHTLRLPVFEPERIDQHQLLDGIRVHQGIAHGQHSTHGMAHDRRPRDAA